jgi:hypothetical protein
MAAGDIKTAFGATTALTITLNGLASSATGARESTVVDNGTNLYLDALVTVIFELAAGSPANDKAVYVYAYGSEDGTNYTDNATGADAAITLRDPTNLRLIGVIACPDAGGLSYKSHPMSVAAAFGGRLPRKWGIVVRNYTGVAGESSGCSASYSGVYATVAQ